jgi:hypothetical protein
VSFRLAGHAKVVHRSCGAKPDLSRRHFSPLADQCSRLQPTGRFHR